MRRAFFDLRIRPTTGTGVTRLTRLVRDDADAIEPSWERT